MYYKQRVRVLIGPRKCAACAIVFFWPHLANYYAFKWFSFINPKNPFFKLYCITQKPWAKYNIILRKSIMYPIASLLSFTEERSILVISRTAVGLHFSVQRVELACFTWVSIIVRWYCIQYDKSFISSNVWSFLLVLFIYSPFISIRVIKADMFECRI